MSERRSVVSDNYHAQKYSTGTNALSIASSASSAPNLAPFEGLTPDQVAFISSIIRRVPLSVTTFVPVFKAYQDEFEDRDLNPTDDQFYYNLLLKLGMIRAENWQKRWNKILDHFNYEDSLPPSPQIPPLAGPVSRDPPAHQPAFEGEDDVFTLHSQGESSVSAAPPSYFPKPGKQLESDELAHGYVSQEEPVRYASSSKKPSSSLVKNVVHRRASSSITPGQASIHPRHGRETNSPTNTIPPSYRTLPRTAPSKNDHSEPASNRARDDAATWRMIEMERDADIFRRDSLLSRCFDVWYKGLKWVETTTIQLDNARNDFHVRSVLSRWRTKASAAIEETKRAAAMDRIRVLNSAISKWRLRAWTLRRKRWADEMRSRMVTMRTRVEHRYLQEALVQWRRANTLKAASKHHNLTLILNALAKWNQRLHNVIDLNYRGDELSQRTETVVLERALSTWKWRVHYSISTKVLQEKQGNRLQRSFFQVWKQRTHTNLVASGFNDVRIMRSALHAWLRRRAMIQSLERRAIARQNKPLISAVFRIWIAQTRLQQYMKGNRQKEQQAVQFATDRQSKSQGRFLQIWQRRLGDQLRLERRAQKAYEITLKAKALIQWRSQMWQHSKMLKQAKQAHRYFLKRSAWETWKKMLENKKRERRLQVFLARRLRQTLQLWSSRTKAQRNLRRKGEVVLMATQMRILREALQRWTLRVVFLKDREYGVVLGYKERILSAYLQKWTVALQRQQDNTSLMQSFQDVKREENLRRVLAHWLQATRRKRALVELEHEARRAYLARIFDKWQDRFLENSLRPVELEVILQSQTNLLFKTFRLWEARTQSIPAVRFRAHYLRATAWRAWKAAMPAAMKRKEAKTFESHAVLGRALAKWKEKYKTKIQLKAIARARYLRLPPAPAKPAPSRMLLVKPASTSRSVRSASPPRDPIRRISSIVIPPKAESSRAPSPTSTRTSFHALGLLGRKRPIFHQGPSSAGAASRSSLEDRRESVASWDGHGPARARPKTVLSDRPGSMRRRPKPDDEEEEESD